MTTALYGLDVRVGHRVDAATERTWKALLDLTAWWPRCREEGLRLLFEPHVGGRLGTSTGPTFDDGRDGSLWGVVTTWRSGRELAVREAGNGRIVTSAAGHGCSFCASIPR
jgi:hypothetical protein